MIVEKHFCKKPLRSLISVASAASLVSFSILGTSTIASATAQGCTAAPSGYICNTTRGDKARVDTIYAIRGRSPSSGFICNWAADVSVLAPGGRVKWFRHYEHTGCTPARAYVKFNVNKTFNCGDETSIRFYEGGVPQGGYAIVKLNCR